jgi:hemoglobin/transferrin/lactoferrin receptor protein
MRKSLRLSSLSTLVITTMFPVANATEPNQVTSLDAVTVYATRSLQSSFDVPSIVSTVDPTAPGNSVAGDIGDLLEFVLGVEVDNGPRRNGQTISIRGFDDEAIITLIDGRRQNFESAHDGRFFIDPSLLKRVEIVKGASSAIYGGGAIGGVVAFETKDAADFLAPGETKGLFTSFGYRSANNEISPVVTGFTRAGGWDVLASINYRNSGDIELGDGNQLDTEDEVLSGLFKAGYTFNDFHTIKFQAQILNNDGQEPNNGAGGITTSNPLVDKRVKDNQFSVKYAYTNPDNQWLNPKLHFYYNDTEVEEVDIVGSVNSGRRQTRQLNTMGFTIDNQSRLAFSDHNKHILSYGFEIYNDQQTGRNSFIGARAGVPDAEATNYGFYLQDEIALNTAIGDFLIIPATRFDQYKSNDENGNSQDENEVSPKLSASYKPTKNVVLFGSWAQAFRAPNLTELYPAGQHFPGVSFCPAPIPGCPPVPIVTVFPNNNFIANPNLRPEVVRTAELGAGIDFDGVLAKGDRVKIKGSFYESTGDDFIAQDVNIAAGTTRNFNIPTAKLRGWELEGQYGVGALSARLGLSYVKATNDDTGEYLSNNVPLTLVADLNYRLNAIESVIGWRARFAEENDRVGNNDVPTAGYGVHDLYYRWAPTNQWKRLTVDLGIENIFDKAYSRRFATLLEEGRSYVARVSYQW